MKASYKLNVEQHQRRLGLTHKELNKLDAKHNNINLIKQLQLLEPEEDDSSSSEEDTGFYGSFVVENQKADGSQPRHMDVYLAFNDIALTPSQQINGDDDFTFTIAEADRLPLPGSILQLKVTFQNNTEGVDIDAYDGYEPVEFSNNPLDEENTLSMLVNENNYDEGQCSVTFVVSFEPL